MELNKISENHINPVIILGAMKAGTTTLYNYLIAHPEICPCIKKEPEYFSENFGNPELKKKAYLNLFPLGPEHKYYLEASTSYTKFPEERGVPQRIKAYGLKPKFIYIIRNPFDRIRSHYNFMQPHFNWKKRITDDHLIKTSSYYLQLRQYLDFFPKENFLILDFDELTNTPEKSCSKVFNFLNITSKGFEIDQNTHTNKTIEFNRKAKKIKLIINKAPLPYRVNKFLRQMTDKLFPPDQKQLKPAEKKYIHSNLQNDMKTLATEFKVDVKKWGF